MQYFVILQHFSKISRPPLLVLRNTWTAPVIELASGYDRDGRPDGPWSDWEAASTKPHTWLIKRYRNTELQKYRNTKTRIRLHNTTQTKGPVADGLIERAPALSPIHDLSTSLQDAATTRARKGERGKVTKAKLELVQTAKLKLKLKTIFLTFWIPTREAQYLVSTSYTKEVQMNKKDSGITRNFFWDTL